MYGRNGITTVPMKSKICLIARLYQPSGLVDFLRIKSEFLGVNIDGIQCVRCQSTEPDVYCFKELGVDTNFGYCENCMRGLSVGNLTKEDIDELADAMLDNMEDVSGSY